MEESREHAVIWITLVLPPPGLQLANTLFMNSVAGDENTASAKRQETVSGRQDSALPTGESCICDKFLSRWMSSAFSMRLTWQHSSWF